MNHARPISISFSGVDGAGKSTQIQALRQALEREGMRVRIVAFWDDIAALTRLREGAGHRIFKGEKGVGSPENPVNRRDKNVRAWPMAPVRLGLYLLDALSTRIRVRQTLRSGADAVIFDRYIYDQFANLNLRRPLLRAYVRAVMRLAPRLDVGYILDADPAQARARKPEYPLDFIELNRRAYLDLAEILGGLTVIPAGAVADVHANILRHLPIHHGAPQVPMDGEVPQIPDMESSLKNPG
ncbi:MAG: thymidylate kinase [Terracidiphilus sp.]